MAFLSKISLVFHKTIAKGPRWLALAYLCSLSLLARALNKPSISRLLQNRIFGPKWPSLEFGPRKVVLGSRTAVFLRPHLGEFDEEVLFSHTLSYEYEVFGWLEKHAAKNYDAIIEIGANVGVYSVFFDRLSREPGSRLKKIFSFEPAREPYRRLLGNLAANKADRVVAFPVAVGTQCGFEPFYEPQDHLTNGSFDREFAALFSDVVTADTVMVLDAKHLKYLFDYYERILLKIDVEGYEPQLLVALGKLIERYKPDIVVEVLAPTVNAVEAAPFLEPYLRLLITDQGPVAFPKLVASKRHRDWLLQPLK